MAEAEQQEEGEDWDCRDLGQAGQVGAGEEGSGGKLLLGRQVLWAGLNNYMYLIIFTDQFSQLTMASTSYTSSSMMPSTSTIVECYCGDNNCRQCNLLLQMEGGV